jgi:NTE family protein
MKQKVAFVFSGGGAKGAFQVGVLKILDKKGIKADVCYGSSIGSINSVLYSHLTIPEIEQVWLNLKGKKSLASFNWSTLIGTSDGLYNLDPTKKKLKKIMKNDPKCEVVVTKVDLKTGHLIYSRSTEEDFVDSVIASASIPIAMSPVNNCIDGAMREKAPLKRAIMEGATDIHVFLCNPVLDYPGQYKETGSFLKLGKIAVRTLEILNHEVFLGDIDKCLSYNKKANKRTVKLHVYSPAELLIDTLEFDPEKIRKAISQGANTVNQTRWL